ncbi:MAG: nitroreductase family protein [Candidatus Neomarinimicrobiota bacterium]|nr:nitroreductase family protein [Candidatus Neomarinimicrobiota bacterium]
MFKELLNQRRATRSLAPVEINQKMIKDLAESAQLMPSCFNKQPWRFVFVFDKKQLTNLHQALNKGNEWARKASLIVAVFTKKDLDCVVKEREYFLFDTGMATAALILRATEMGLVAHPIAGYDEEKTKKILNIPDEFEVITLVNIGKQAPEIDPELSDFQKKAETERPDRHPFENFAYLNKYN